MYCGLTERKRLAGRDHAELIEVACRRGAKDAEGRKVNPKAEGFSLRFGSLVLSEAMPNAHVAIGCARFSPPDVGHRFAQPTMGPNVIWPDQSTASIAKTKRADAQAFIGRAESEESGEHWHQTQPAPWIERPPHGKQCKVGPQRDAQDPVHPAHVGFDTPDRFLHTSPGSSYRSGLAPWRRQIRGAQLRCDTHFWTHFSTHSSIHAPTHPSYFGDCLAVFRPHRQCGRQSGTMSVANSLVRVRHWPRPDLMFRCACSS